MVARTSKLTYEWRGMHHLEELLQRLLREDDELGAPFTHQFGAILEWFDTYRA